MAAGVLIDVKNSITRSVLIKPQSMATNNSNVSAGLDISNVIGQLAVVVNVGASTAGDTNSTLAISLQSSLTNNVANSVAVAGVSNGVQTNAGGLAVIALDTRAVTTGKYLFAVPIITGGNSPAWPLDVIAEYQKQVT